MKILLIRHGKTKGNLENRYVGTTDEALCEEGIEQLKKMVELKTYPQVDQLYVSPMRRCIETAKIIYQNKDFKVCNDLRECDFGEFEYKNYIELAGNKNYQKWIDSYGTKEIPQGESQENFKRRTQVEFKYIISQSNGKQIAFIVHGGSIMSIMDKYAVPPKGFYEWQVKNGEGFLCEFDAEEMCLQVQSKICLI